MPMDLVFPRQRPGLCPMHAADTRDRRVRLQTWDTASESTDGALALQFPCVACLFDQGPRVVGAVVQFDRVPSARSCR